MGKKLSFKPLFNSMVESYGIALDTSTKLTGNAIERAGFKRPSNKWLKRGVLTATFATAAGTAIVAPTQALGLIGLAHSFIAPLLKDNRHSRSLNVNTAALLTSQYAMNIGAGFSGLIMGALATIRPAYFSLIPDEQTELRQKRAKQFWAAGTAAIAATASTVALTNGLSLLAALPAYMPILSMTCGTFADRMESDKSHYARALRFFGSLNVGLYDAFFAGNMGSAMANLKGHALNWVAIFKYDVPKYHKNGDKLSLNERLSQYFRFMNHNEPTTALSPYDYREYNKQKDAERESAAPSTKDLQKTGIDLKDRFGKQENNPPPLNNRNTEKRNARRDDNGPHITR